MQMPATANPLDQLKDIHTPDAIGLWPPAIGWYLIAAFLIAALVLVGVISVAPLAAKCLPASRATRMR